MEIAVHGRHVEVTDEVRDLAERKLASIGRYFGGLERGELWFSDHRIGHLRHPCSCEVVLEGRGTVIRAHGTGSHQAEALEEAMERATYKVRRNKEKLVGRSRPRHRANGVRQAAPGVERATRPPAGAEESGGESAGESGGL